MNAKCRISALRPKTAGSHAVLFNAEGMALVLTLMVLAVLTALVVEFAYGVYVNTNALYNWQASQKLSITAKSAIKIASKLISENINQYSYTHPDLLKDFNGKPFAVAQGTATIWIEDESSKFNVNSLVFPNGTLNEKAYDSFLRLLKALDLDERIADRVADWIDADSVPRLQDSERKAKNGYLDSVDELLLIEGVDRKSYDTLMPYVTIYGNGLININSAGAPVLMSLSEAIDKEMAGRVIRYREDAPFERAEDILKVAGFETTGTSLMGRITVKGTVFHVTSAAKTGDIKRIIESILEISDNSSIVRYWKEI